jgi:hypothetical protein
MFESLEPYEIPFNTGWFGVPGDMLGRKSTKIHLVNKEDETPICGLKLSQQHIFQWNSRGVHMPYVECKHCIRKINKIREGNKNIK